MKNNYFLCVTEYHVLLAILLSIEEFGADNVINNIVLCNAGRFNDKDIFKDIRYNNIVIKNIDQAFIVKHEFIEEVLVSCSGSLFLFNLNNPHFLYLLYKLKKANKATAFVQEGLASYNFRNFALRQNLGLLKKNISIIFKSGVLDIGFLAYAFGFKGHLGKIFDNYDIVINSSLVDTFWLSHPEEANYGFGKIKKLPDFSDRSIAAANTYFHYSQNVHLKENDIVFIDQEIKGSFELIEKISKKFPNNTIYIKLHPRTDKAWAKSYETIANVHMITWMQGIPIELLLQNLNHAIVLTPFSSALLINNSSCRYYYLYKWFLNNGYNIGSRNLLTPGKHIFSIEKLEEIELY